MLRLVIKVIRVKLVKLIFLRGYFPRGSKCNALRRTVYGRFFFLRRCSNAEQPLVKSLKWILHPRLPNTPPKFNMEPENNGFQKDFPFPGTYFQVPC